MHAMKCRSWMLLLAALILGACSGDGGDGPLTPGADDVEITVSTGSLEMAVGETQQLNATVTGTSNTGVNWSVDDDDIVSVSASGLVTALAAGTARITAAAAANANRRATIDVEVTSANPPPGTGTLLTSGQPLTNLSGAEDSEAVYRVNVPAGATRLVVTTQGGAGDVDLFLLFGAPDQSGEPVCASENYDNSEECTVNAPAAGVWYIVLLGWEAYSGVTLLATVETGGPSEPANPTLHTGTTGSGYGSVTPATAQHAAGTRVLVAPEADPFYEFRGWENGFCPSAIDYRAYSYLYNGCYVTLEDEDVHAIARFEPITFTADASVDYTVTSSNCTWQNSLRNMEASVTFSRRGGVDYAMVRVEGTRVYTSNQEGCTSSTSGVNASREVAMSGSGLSVELVLGQGASSTETLTLTALDLSIDAPTLGSFSYLFTGTDRSGSHSQPLMPWSPVVQ